MNILAPRGARMIGRRRHPRFAVSTFVTGVLEVVEDAAMESRDGREFVIITRTAPAVGEEATLLFEDAEGQRSIRVRVVDTQLYVRNDDVCHRVRLARLDDGAAPADTDTQVAE